MIRTFEVAEGGAFDARGMPTLIGFSPPMWNLPVFPMTFVAFVVAVGEDDESIGQPSLLDSIVSMELSVLDPDQRVIFFETARAPGSVKDDTGLPGRLSMSAHILFEASRPGRYTVNLRCMRDERDETFQRSIYLRQVGVPLGDAVVN